MEMQCNHKLYYFENTIATSKKNFYEKKYYKYNYKRFILFFLFSNNN